MRRFFNRIRRRFNRPEVLDRELLGWEISDILEQELDVLRDSCEDLCQVLSSDDLENKRISREQILRLSRINHQIKKLDRQMNDVNDDLVFGDESFESDDARFIRFRRLRRMRLFLRGLSAIIMGVGYFLICIFFVSDMVFDQPWIGIPLFLSVTFVSVRMISVWSPFKRRIPDVDDEEDKTCQGNCDNC